MAKILHGECMGGGGGGLDKHRSPGLLVRAAMHAVALG
jgi:hypothetical protein